jgi:hypothetical protein
MIARRFVQCGRRGNDGPASRGLSFPLALHYASSWHLRCRRSSACRGWHLWLDRLQRYSADAGTRHPDRPRRAAQRRLPIVALRYE